MPAVISRRLLLAREALKERPEDPTGDPLWREFREAAEENTGLAREEWPRFRQGLRRLERLYAGRLPLVPLRRVLAEGAFFCATHWRHDRRIVLPAIDQLLRLPIGPRGYTYVAAEFWHWARYRSPRDLPEAEELLALTPICLERVDQWNHWNLTSMLRAVVEEHRPAKAQSP